MPAERVAVIGAGACGLAALKCLLDEGLDVVCFERTHGIGGLWNYREHSPEGYSNVMKSTVMNTSKEMWAYSDFPPKAEMPNFMHNESLYEYMVSYADHFDLMKHIHLNTEVLRVQRAPSYADTGKWTVATTEGTSEFDAIVICSGHHNTPYIPEINGMERFEGKVIHSQRYRHWHGYEGKKVLVVGFGNSALDIAVELSRVAKKTILSTRTGGWLFRRVGSWGLPFDVFLNTRFLYMIKKFVPADLIDLMFQNDANYFFDHDLYGCRPKHGFFAQHATVNDNLPDCLAKGAVMLKPGIKDFTSNCVEFDDYSMESIDCVILCTGYDITFSFLEEDITYVKDNKVELYMNAFPVHLPHPTLAFVGLFQASGAFAPVGELQARWIAKIFKGEREIPSKEIMQKHVEKNCTAMEKTFARSRRHTVQVDYILYGSELAKMIGCEPRWMRMMWNDLPLFLQCFFGPCTPYIYRLEGPGSIPEARDIVLSTDARITRPFTMNRHGEVQPQYTGRQAVKFMAAWWPLMFHLIWPVILYLLRLVCEKATKTASAAVRQTKDCRQKIGRLRN